MPFHPSCGGCFQDSTPHSYTLENFTLKHRCMNSAKINIQGWMVFLWLFPKLAGVSLKGILWRCSEAFMWPVHLKRVYNKAFMFRAAVIYF